MRSVDECALVFQRIRAVGPHPKVQLLQGIDLRLQQLHDLGAEFLESHQSLAARLRSALGVRDESGKLYSRLAFGEIKPD